MGRRGNYTNREKFRMLTEASIRISNGESLRSVSVNFGVQPCQLRKWRNNQDKIRNGNPKAASLHPGKPSDLANIEEELLMWFFELREQGFIITRKMMAVKASQLDAAFRNKTVIAKDSAVARFINRHNIVSRAITHESQRQPAEVQQEALEFVIGIRPLLWGANRDQRFVLNMDQTPVFFSMARRMTLNTRGARTVNARVSTNSTMRVTVAVTLTASGKMLKPYIIYKGKPNGKIQREFGAYNPSSFYACQDRAWMDEGVMIKWINAVLKPYVQQAPPGITPLILLDKYKCHTMPSIVQRIEDQGVQVEHIPGGCTGLCQPVDVGIGKPLKNRIREQWENWMVNENTTNGAISTKPSRQTLANWIVDALEGLGENIAKNSWCHGTYSYFPNEPTRRDADNI